MKQVESIETSVSLIERTRLIIEQWALWMRDGRTNLSYGNNVLASPRKGGLYTISDDEAIRIDMKIASMKRRDRRMYDYFYHYFVYKRSYRDVAQLYHAGETSVRQYVKSAIVWLDAALFS